MPRFSTSGAAAARAKRRCAYMTAVAEPTTAYRKTCGIVSRIRSRVTPIWPLSWSAVPLRPTPPSDGDAEQLWQQYYGYGREHEEQRESDAEESPADSRNVFRTAVVDVLDQGGHQQRHEERAGQEPVVDEVRQRVGQLVGVAEEGRPEDGADHDHPDDASATAQSRPGTDGDRVARSTASAGQITQQFVVGSVHRLRRRKLLTLIGCGQRAPPRTAGMVFRMITRSIRRLRLVTYSRS